MNYEIKNLTVCVDCVLMEHFAASEMDDVPTERIAEINLAREELGVLSLNFVGDPDGEHFAEKFFSRQPCDLCRSPLGGDRFDMEAVCLENGEKVA